MCLKPELLLTIINKGWNETPALLLEAEQKSELQESQRLGSTEPQGRDILSRKLSKLQESSSSQEIRNKGEIQFQIMYAQLGRGWMREYAANEYWVRAAQLRDQLLAFRAQFNRH